MGTNVVNPVVTFMGLPGFSSNREVDVLPTNQSKIGDDIAVNLLDQKHLDYEFNYEAWLDLSLLYTGGAAIKNRCERLLKKRPREDEEVYAARMDRFTYQNILGTGLGWYGAAMFDNSPEIFFNGKAGENYWDKFLQNCDGLGTTYVDFFKKVFQVLLTYGAAWVLTDIPAITEDKPSPITLADQKMGGYLDVHEVLYSPLNVINWQVDELGKLIYAVVKTEYQEQQFLKKPEIVSTWYYYDRTSYRVYEDRRTPQEEIKIATDDSGRIAKFLRSGKHVLADVQRVPIRRMLLSEGLWLANRAYLLLIDHLNQDNTLAWSLFMSNLAIPVVIGDVDASNMTYSETGYLQFPAGTEYTWSEPEGKSFIQSAKRVESVREECFRSMNLQAQGRSMRATPAMQSGRSKQLEMAPAKQILSGMGDDLRRHMQDVLVDVKDARGEFKVQPDVRGFNFQDDMTTEEVFAVTSLLSLKIPSKKFEKIILKKVAKAWMVDANRNQLAEVYDEIDAAPTLEEAQEEQMMRRAEMVKQDLAKSMDDSPELPPGRGGDGPKPEAPKPVGSKPDKLDKPIK